MVPPPLSRGNGVCNRGMREDRRCTVKHRVDAIARSPAYLAERSRVRQSANRTFVAPELELDLERGAHDELGVEVRARRDVRGASAFVLGQAGFGDVPNPTTPPTA